MKELYKYWGRVIKYNPAPNLSYVTLKDSKTGELHETSIDSEKIATKGIDYDGCEFEILILKTDDGNEEGIVNKLETQNFDI